MARMGRREISYTIFGRKPEGRPKLRWKFVTRIALKETARKGMYWIHVTQDIDKWRNFVSTEMNIPVSHNAG